MRSWVEDAVSLFGCFFVWRLNRSPLNRWRPLVAPPMKQRRILKDPDVLRHFQFEYAVDFLVQRDPCRLEDVQTATKLQSERLSNWRQLSGTFHLIETRPGLRAGNTPRLLENSSTRSPRAGKLVTRRPASARPVDVRKGVPRPYRGGSTSR